MGAVAGSQTQARSPASRRMVRISQGTVAALRDHLTRGGERGPRLFSTHRGTPIASAVFFTCHWSPLRERAGSQWLRMN
jgi:hypothetical protein